MGGFAVLVLVGCGTSSDTAAPAGPKEVSVDLGGGVTMELVLVPAGSFTMGTDTGEDDEYPAHEIAIARPFYLGKFEVTQEQWQAVTGSNPSKFKGAKSPIETVSWDDCQAFLKKLNEKLGGANFRLPTEAEWEYACRAGSTTRYPFGDGAAALGEYAWFKANSAGMTHPVGQKKPNAWGLHDMHGNVWEWCLDWYDEYRRGAQTAPRGPSRPAGMALRIVRGGSWKSSANLSRSANRNSNKPGARKEDYGFRVARSVP